ncbi:hypothetical protein [Hyperthermus butylicus]|uniref:CopG family transcriptional regulator n=1 Tax=Hyperthermus butylicus (strain DSM 5456 / JCM 9403 / PLM1-5) TaxID=415426 RepID=A2BMW4_HYPBU|nr:hypothetical protein [Hyperthermus butylicus]ABM81325.1 hypothetical protein Hbut_1503 [Hyperthermus butylicus DSM 5456]
MTEYIEVRIPRDLYEKAKKFVEEQGGFQSVEELVEFLLREALLIEEAGEQKISKEDEEKVKERLKQLGYI